MAIMEQPAVLLFDSVLEPCLSDRMGETDMVSFPNFGIAHFARESGLVICTLFGLILARIKFGAGEK